jgi:hypothetical protein
MEWDSDRKGPVRLRGVLGGLSGIKGWQKRFSRAVLWKVWADVVGTKISDHAWPERFQDTDTLVIVVSDSVWMQELSFQRSHLLDALNAHLPPDAQLAGMRFELPGSVLIGPPAGPLTSRRKEARVAVASRPRMPTESRMPLFGSSRIVRFGRP